MKTPQEVMIEHQQRSDPHDNHCICGFGDNPKELGLSWAEHLWEMLRTHAGVIGPTAVGSLKAIALRDAARSLDPLTKNYSLGTSDDGEEITVADMLRDYAENYERPGIGGIRAVLRDLLARGYKLHDTNLPEAMHKHGIRVIGQQFESGVVRENPNVEPVLQGVFGGGAVCPECQTRLQAIMAELREAQSVADWVDQQDRWELFIDHWTAQPCGHRFDAGSWVVITTQAGPRLYEQDKVMVQDDAGQWGNP